MRSKWILGTLLVNQLLLLLWSISPGFWGVRNPYTAVSQEHNNRSSQTVQSARLEYEEGERNQYIACSLTILSIVLIIAYGGRQQQKREA
jgi:hypothetical protein